MRLGLAIFGALMLLSPVRAQTRQDYRTFLVANEGYSLTPYVNANETHIGIGHLLRPGERHGRYTAAQVEALFSHDLDYAVESCQMAFTRFDELPRDVKLALVSLSFTVGRRGLMEFVNLRIAIHYRSYDLAAHEVAESKWWRQVQPERANQAYRILHNQS